MTTDIPALSPPDPENQAHTMVLRGSRELQQIPAERAPAVPAAAPAAPAADPAPAEARWPVLHRQLLAAPPPELTWALASAALAAGVGWVVERRRRRLLELERDPVLWASTRSQQSTGPVRPGLDDILPDSPDPDRAARAIYVSGIGETNSRREATLIDLQMLRDNLHSLREQHDMTAAAELLEQHLVDFRYTSPWVFLELRELYKQLERPKEWELAREAFRSRFGQNAPQWTTASTAGDEVADDKQLCSALVRKWPQREARLFILRWMLGDANSRQKNSGPPQLALGVYRDMMLLDAILDDAMPARAGALAAAA